MRKGTSKGDSLFKGAIYSRVDWRQRFAVDVFHSRFQGGSLPSCATTVRQPLTANQRLIVGPIANRGSQSSIRNAGGYSCLYLRSRYLTELSVVENESQIPLVPQSYVSQIVPSFWDGGAIRNAEGAWTPDVDIIAQGRCAVLPPYPLRGIFSRSCVCLGDCSLTYFSLSSKLMRGVRSGVFLAS